LSSAKLVKSCHFSSSCIDLDRENQSVQQVALWLSGKSRSYDVAGTDASFACIVDYNAYSNKSTIAEQSDEGIAQDLRINCAGDEKSGIPRKDATPVEMEVMGQYHCPIAPLILFWPNGDDLMSAVVSCRPWSGHVGIGCTT
jgi:hypothetical protein